MTLQINQLWEFGERFIFFFRIKQVAADIEVFGDLGHGLSGADELDRLSFELCGVSLAWLGHIHLG